MNKAKLQKKLIILSISCLAALSLAQAGCLNYQNKWNTGGLGLQLAQVEDGVVIKEIAPSFSNTEAALLTGDYIVQVDDTDVSNLPKEVILNLISGPVGGLVTITVLRNGEPVSFEIERIIQKDAPKRTLHSVKLGEPVTSKKAKTAISASFGEVPATTVPATPWSSGADTVQSDADTDAAVDTDADTDADTAADAAVDAGTTDTTAEE